jgi:Protein of unknown function (DUF4242)
MAGLVPAIGRCTLPLFWHSTATDGRHKAGHHGEARFIEGGSADGRWELAMTEGWLDNRFVRSSRPFQTEETMALRKYVIERDIPAVGSLEREQLRGAAAKSNSALNQLGPAIQWVESYVAADKTFCVYLAKDEDIIRKHAEISGFPATKITEVRKMIDPTTEHPDS